MQGIIEKITNTIKGLFASNGTVHGSVVGLDIGASAIKVVQIKKENNKAVLETYGSIALGPFLKTEVGKPIALTPEIIAQSVVQLFKESGISGTTVQCVIPTYSALVFVLSIPVSIPTTSFKDVVPTEARKYIPVPIEEVTLDWFLLPKKDVFDMSAQESKEVVEDKNEVLVVAIHNEAIKRYQDGLAQAQVESSSFEVEAFSQVRAILTHELAPVVVVDVGASKTKIAIVEYGIVKSTHIVNKGGADFTNAIKESMEVNFAQAENWKRDYGLNSDGRGEEVAKAMMPSVDFILSEINTAMIQYERTSNRSINKVFLTGGGVLVKGFTEKAYDYLRTETVLGNPFYKVDAPAFLAPTLITIGPEFSGAIGIALRALDS